jgi:hypothetical protein
MAWARQAAALGLCVALAGYVPPADAGYGVGAAPVDSGGYGSPPPATPVASAGEIQNYLYNGTVEVNWYDSSELLYQIDCGFIDGYGTYEADSFESEPDGYYYYESWMPADGTWSVQGSQVCLNLTYYDEATGERFPLNECFTAEWSTDDSLLLIDGSNRIAAEVFAWDGKDRFLDGCGM